MVRGHCASSSSGKQGNPREGALCSYSVSWPKTNIQKKSLKVCVDTVGNDLRMRKGCALCRGSTDFKHSHSEDGHGGLISDKRRSFVNYLWKGSRFLLHKVSSADLTFIVFIPRSKETMGAGLGSQVNHE